MNAVTKEFIEAVEAQFEGLNEEVKAALVEAKAAQAIGQELEQKMASMRFGGAQTPRSWGGQVIDSEQIKSLRELTGSQPGRVRVEVKDVTSASASGGSLVVPERQAVNGMPRRRMQIRDLMDPIDTTSGSIEYAHQTTRDNQAAPQVEGALKAESNYAWELRDLPIRTIAHWTKASVQILADAPQLQSLIDTELRYGLGLAEEDQLLNGDGTGANLNGMVTNATAFVDPLALSSPTMIDTLGTAILQVALADFMPNGIAMHTSDWMRIRLLKDADGKYLLGDPGEAIEPRLFGLPVIATTSMEIDKFLVGDFARAATLYDREGANVALSTEDGDNFTRNMVTIRAEERLGLAIKQPTALSYGDFGNVA